MAILIDDKVCTRCGRCIEICPEDALGWDNGRVVPLYPQECWHCGSCTYECPVGAIEVDFDLALGPKTLTLPKA